MSSLVRSATRFVDVGSYSGIYTLVACADGQADVIAFEPNPASCLLLDRNVRQNGWTDRVEIHCSAVSNKIGTGRLRIPLDTTAASIGSDDGMEVPITTLDDVLAGRSVDVIKIDVEGHELQALQGAEQIIRAFHPALIVEVLEPEAFREVAEQVRRYDYDRCWHLSGSGAIETTEFVREPKFANFLWQ